MFKYMSSLLLALSVAAPALALRDLKGLRGTVCVTNTTLNTDGTLKDVTLTITEGCSFTFSGGKTSITVLVTHRDSTAAFQAIGLISPTNRSSETDFFEFEVVSKCPFKNPPSITVTPSTTVQDLAPVFTGPNAVALISTLFVANNPTNTSFMIRAYFTLAAFATPPQLTPQALIGAFLASLLQGTFATPASPFCIHFIAADKPCNTHNS